MALKTNTVVLKINSKKLEAGGEIKARGQRVHIWRHLLKSKQQQLVAQDEVEDGLRPT